MIFRQLFDANTWTYTYLLADDDSRDALLIDPVFEQHHRDMALLRELGLRLCYTLDTHVHADHVTGAWLAKQAVGSQIALSRAAGAEGVDRPLDHGDTVKVGALTIEVRATPGHTDGCLTYVCADHTMAFTGDALLIRGAGRTDFQQGDARVLFESVRQQIFSLPGACTLYPGHDYNGRTSTTVDEERAHNPRLGDGVREQDFVGYMNNLGLSHPKRLDVAVPANMCCGCVKGDTNVPQLPEWGPVVRTFAGVLEIDPEWVYAERQSVLVVDVRDTSEVATSEFGHIENAMIVPLDALRERIADIPRDRPVITVCAAGARSAQAALILEKAGVPQVANLAGGMMRWHAFGYPVT